MRGRDAWLNSYNGGTDCFIGVLTGIAPANREVDLRVIERMRHNGATGNYNGNSKTY